MSLSERYERRTVTTFKGHCPMKYYLEYLRVIITLSRKGGGSCDAVRNVGILKDGLFIFDFQVFLLLHFKFLAFLHFLNLHIRNAH